MSAQRCKAHRVRRREHAHQRRGPARLRGGPAELAEELADLATQHAKFGPLRSPKVRLARQSIHVLYIFSITIN